MTPKTKSFLRNLPIDVIRNYVIDAITGDGTVRKSTFTMAISPELADCDPIEVFDWCVEFLKYEIVIPQVMTTERGNS